MRHQIFIFCCTLLLITCIFPGQISADTPGGFSAGWAEIDITPDQPVLLRGQFHARVSEGVMDPVTATALALESGNGPGSVKVILISCDLISVTDGTRDGSPDNLRDNVRRLLSERVPEVRSEQVVLNATHTHTAPLFSRAADSKEAYGVELDAMAPHECLEFLSERIASVAEKAWRNREPGGISYGLGQAVVGHNRLQVDMEGRSRMYGSTNHPDFSHIEGYEDHSVNIVYTWNSGGQLTGLIINVASPSQVSEGEYLISADFWHDTRVELRKRFGNDIYVLAQCSAAGDQSPRSLMVAGRAEERMQDLKFPEIPSGNTSNARRMQIASRISDAVSSLFPLMKENINWAPVFDHKADTVYLTRRLVTQEDVTAAVEESRQWEEEYLKILKRVERNPAIMEEPRWYFNISRAYSRMMRGQRVQERFNLERDQPRMPVEVQVIRIDDIAIATNPFELYLDYAMRIKARSPAIQTFIVQLAGDAAYLPTYRSIAGGAYGAVPASTLIGPEGGQELVEMTLKIIEELWE